MKHSSSLSKNHIILGRADLARSSDPLKKSLHVVEPLVYEDNFFDNWCFFFVSKERALLIVIISSNFEFSIIYFANSRSYFLPL
jgi:hypothetical protein